MTVVDSTPGDVALIVVTYNSVRLLDALAHSLVDGMRGAGEWRLTIVDNASSDGTLDRAAELMPSAALVQMGWNGGYAAAINEGLTRSVPARGYLVLNPDIRLDPDAVARMLSCLSTNGTGQVVPVIRTVEDELITSLRREPSIRRALGEALVGGTRAGRHAMFGEIFVDRKAYTKRTVGDWATGAAVLFSEACRVAVGEWDESFFLYSEETDFSLRARDAGLLLRLEPSASAVHLGGEQHAAPGLYGLALVNRVRLYRRRHGSCAAVAYWAALVVGQLARVRPREPVHRAGLKSLFGLPEATITALRGPRPAAVSPRLIRSGGAIRS